MKKAKLFKPPTSTNKKFTKKRLYDTTDWAEYRVRFISANPLCYACGQRARVVDHVISAKGNEKLFWEVTNLIPLCKSDHDFITQNFDKHIVAKTEEKMKWIERKRIETDTNVRVKIVPLNPQK